MKRRSCVVSTAMVAAVGPFVRVVNSAQEDGIPVRGKRRLQTMPSVDRFSFLKEAVRLRGNSIPVHFKTP